MEGIQYETAVGLPIGDILPRLTRLPAAKIELPSLSTDISHGVKFTSRDGIEC
jgi:hypothetical protein